MAKGWFHVFASATEGDDGGVEHRDDGAGLGVAVAWLGAKV